MVILIFMHIFGLTTDNGLIALFKWDYLFIYFGGWVVRLFTMIIGLSLLARILIITVFKEVGITKVTRPLDSYY